MKTPLKTLLETMIDKNYSVYVGGEFERKTDFLGVIKLLADYSSYLEYTDEEKKEMITEWLKIKEVYIDSTIYVKITN